MLVTEQYAKAVRSSNLKDDSMHHNTDVLIAVAMSPVKIASQMFRVKYSNDATTYHALRADWTAIVINKAQLRHWPANVNPRIVAETALDYWINPLCPCCQGRGYDASLAPKGKYQESCKPCNATGLKPVQANSTIKKYVQDMVETLSDMERYAGSAAVKKLSKQFTL